MKEYLYRVSLSFTWEYRGKTRAPIYVVSKSKEKAREYAGIYLKKGCHIKSISCLGVQLSGVLFSGTDKGK